MTGPHTELTCCIAAALSGQVKCQIFNGVMFSLIPAANSRRHESTRLNASRFSFEFCDLFQAAFDSQNQYAYTRVRLTILVCEYW